MMSRAKNRSKGKAKATNFDSRTSAVGRKRTLAASLETPQQPATKRRKRNSRSPVVGAPELRQFVPFSTLQNTQFAQDHSSMPMANLGNNRLRSGFVNARRMQRSASHAGTPSDSDDLAATEDGPVVYDLDTDEEDGGITLNVHGNDHEPIIISDDDDNDRNTQDDEEESDYEDARNEGIGNTVLEDGKQRNANPPSKGAAQLPVGGSALSPPTQGDGDVQFVIDTTPSLPQVRLKDLSPHQLEMQLKYAFWQLDRDQIDLSRLARCLHCQSEGHIDEKCPQKRCSHCHSYGKHDSRLCPRVMRCEVCRQRGHASCSGMKNDITPCDLCSLPGHSEYTCPLRHHLYPVQSPPAPMRLWISCCQCASKSHTIGDCPEATSSSRARWSLKALSPDQVVNLSIQTGVEKLEKEAQNRGMRPDGMKIRGRANQRRSDAQRRDQSDSDDLENFLNHPPRPRNDRFGPPPGRRARQADQYRPDGGDRLDQYDRNDRYDRFAAPSGPDSYRPPRNDFYATDSFGRPRSRSPPRRDVSSKDSPGDAYDSYRPDQLNRRRLSPPRQRHGGRPGPGISIQLPTRKGSNPNLSTGPSSTQAGSIPKGSARNGAAPTRKRNRSKRR